MGTLIPGLLTYQTHIKKKMSLPFFDETIFNCPIINQQLNKNFMYNVSDELYRSNYCSMKWYIWLQYHQLQRELDVRHHVEDASIPLSEEDVQFYEQLIRRPIEDTIREDLESNRYI